MAGERVTLECKNAQRSVPNSLWKAYSAFANTYGETILLGVVEHMEEQKLTLHFENAPVKLTNWKNIILQFFYEDIKLGVSRQRNPLMATLAAKTMIYRGLGSGIIRVMKENVRVEFINEESANQFRTIVWRTIQKSESTIQKNENTTQKSENTIQKSKNTIQKSENTIQKDLTTTQKAVLDFFRNNPHASRDEAIQNIRIVTEGGIKFIIAKLQGLGLLKREGGRKTGVWVVIDKTKDN